MSELSVFESAKQDYEKEIYDLKQEIEYLRSVGSLGILDKKCKELQNINDKQKEVLDKIKKYCKNKIEEQKNMNDFSKYYLENYDKAINIQHLTHSGVMLETIKSTTIKRYEEILELLEEIE